VKRLSPFVAEIVSLMGQGCEFGAVNEVLERVRNEHGDKSALACFKVAVERWKRLLDRKIYSEQISTFLSEGDATLWK
jgi:hypothetical protein